MQTIVVASDLSERSRPAVKRAVELAIAVDARLIVLNVVNNAMPAELSHQLEVGAKTILSDQIIEDANGRGLMYEIQVVIGDPIAEVAATVHRAPADLLIVGQHRRRAFLDQIRETTMEHFIRSSEVPVLLVTQTADRPYQQVLCGTALSGVCAQALETIPKIVPQAELTLFHAHEVSFAKEARRDFGIWKATHPLPKDLPDPIFLEARAQEALEEMLSQGSYDMLAIGGHTRATGGRYFLGNFTANLIRKPPCDLLIAK